MTAYNLIVLVQTLSIIVLAAGVVYLVGNWRGKEYSCLVLFCISTLVNNIGAFIEIVADQSNEILIGTKFSYIGKVFIPLTFFLFVMQYCEIKVHPKIQIILTIFHLSIAGLVFTYPYQHLFYTSVEFTTDGLFPHNKYGHGIMYNVYTACLVGYFIAVFAVIINILRKEKRKKRKIQMYYMLACAVCAISGFVVFLTGITKGYDTTSLSYAICTVLMAIALTKYDLLDTLELVRNYVIDNLSLEIIATDEDDRIIYYNQPIHDIYPEFNENSYEIVGSLISLCEKDEILEKDNKVYKPEYKELLKNGQYRGHILTLSDITDSYNYAQLITKMTEIDPLTGLYNRFAYEYRISEIKKLPEIPENLIIFAMDINGLKTVNDSKGHDAGDSMIYDAAQCIKRGIGGSGECYRIGGDEFAAVITAENADPAEIKKKIEDEAETCQNENYKVSISIGYCCGNEQENMVPEDYEQLADKMMYREKENYYIAKGINRRERDKVFNDICNSYLKILKVNLAEETFEIIKMDINEKSEDTGFSRNIRKWLDDFAKSGMIHKDDVEKYLKFTDLDFLKKEFSDNDKKVVRTFYKRKVAEEYHSVMLEIYPKRKYSPEKPIVFMYVKDMEN